MIKAYLGPMVIFRKAPLMSKRIRSCNKSLCKNNSATNEIEEKHKYCFECGSKIHKKTFEVRHNIKRFGLEEIDYRFEYLERYLFTPKKFSKVLYIDKAKNNQIKNIDKFYNDLNDLNDLNELMSDDSTCFDLSLIKSEIDNFKDYTIEINKILNNFESVEYIILPNMNLISEATYNYFENDNKINIPELEFMKKDLKFFKNNVYFQDYKKALKRHFNEKEVEIVYGFVLYNDRKS